jgi:hypothetical protein
MRDDVQIMSVMDFFSPKACEKTQGASKEVTTEIRAKSS